MAADRSPLQAAYDLAKKHRLLIHHCQERKRGSYPTQYVSAYVVYRDHVRLGRRSSGAALLAFIRKLIPHEADRDAPAHS